jgi:GntR family transcriptional repressor for pyruvate dehydrogenase complex
VLESRRGSGTYVVEVDMDGVFEVRVKLEPLAAEYSALHRSGPEAAELCALIGVMHDQFDDYQTFAAADTRIHALVAASSHRPVLNTTLERITEMASLTRSVTAPERSHRVESLKDIERVVAAIERQHPRRAANAMERHIMHVWEDFKATVGDGDGRKAVLATPVAAST